MKLSSLCSLALLLGSAACSGKGAPPEAPVVDSASTESNRDSTGTDSKRDAGVASRWFAVRDPLDVRMFEATGRLLAPANARAAVTLALTASIVATRAQPGEAVTAGQVLAEVVIPEAARAQGQLEGARLRSEAYAARLLQLEALRSDGLARGGDLAEARARLAEAQASMREAEALLDSVESAGLRRRAKRYEVLAPLAGVVTAVDAPLGSVRGPSDGPIYVVSGGVATRVEARFAFTLPKTANYELWTDGARLAELRLVSQAPEISLGDATRLAWFDPTSKLDLAQGSTVRVRLRKQEGTWVVPLAALSRAEPRSVRTAARGRVEVEVLTTLGSEALVRGALRADDQLAQVEVTP